VTGPSRTRRASGRGPTRVACGGCGSGPARRRRPGGAAPKANATSPGCSPLEAYGWTVLHDLRGPRSAANINHLVIGTPGVFVVDAKHDRGPLHLAHDGGLWHGRYPLAAALSATHWEADKVHATLGAPTSTWCPSWPCMARRCPSGRFSIHGIPVVAAATLPGMLRSLPPVLAPRAGRLGRHPAPGAPAAGCLTLPHKQAPRQAGGLAVSRPAARVCQKGGSWLNWPRVRLKLRSVPRSGLPRC
jgi:hypothetical protein